MSCSGLEQSVTCKYSSLEIPDVPFTLRASSVLFTRPLNSLHLLFNNKILGKHYFPIAFHLSKVGLSIVSYTDVLT